MKFYHTSYIGWEKHNDKLHYRDKNGNYLRNQWSAPTGSMHYFGKEGCTVSNQWYKMSDNRVFYFDNIGHTVKNRWYKLSNNQVFYFDNTGHTVKNRWYKLPDNRVVYFDNTGHTVKNRWYTLPDNRVFYFDETGHTVKNQWFTMPNGTKHYFDNNVHTVKNTEYTIDGIKYNFDKEGHANIEYIKDSSFETKKDGTLRFMGALDKVCQIFYKIGKSDYKYYGYQSDFYIDNVNGNGGKNITIALENSDNKPIEEKAFVIPKVELESTWVDHLSNIGWVLRNGTAKVFLEDSDGNTKEINSQDQYPQYSYDASIYAGKRVRLIFKDNDNKVIDISDWQTIPKVRFIDEPHVNTDYLSLKIQSSANGPLVAIKDLNTGVEKWAGIDKVGVFNNDSTINSKDHTYIIDPSEYSGDKVVVELKDPKSLGNNLITQVAADKVSTLTTGIPIYIPKIKLTSYYDSQDKKLYEESLLKNFLDPYSLTMRGTRNGNAYVTAVTDDPECPGRFVYDRFGVNDGHYYGNNFYNIYLETPGTKKRLVALRTWGGNITDITTQFTVPNKKLRKVSISNNILTGYNDGGNLDDTLTIRILG